MHLVLFHIATLPINARIVNKNNWGRCKISKVFIILIIYFFQEVCSRLMLNKLNEAHYISRLRVSKVTSKCG